MSVRVVLQVLCFPFEYIHSFLSQPLMPAMEDNDGIQQIIDHLTQFHLTNADNGIIHIPMEFAQISLQLSENCCYGTLIQGNEFNFRTLHTILD